MPSRACVGYIIASPEETRRDLAHNIMQVSSAKGKVECRENILLAPVINPAHSNAKTLKLPCSLKILTGLYF